MEVENAPRKIEGWEFQEILRKLAANSNPGSAIPKLENPLKGATYHLHRKHIFHSNRTPLGG
jgi:hypothetical protein